MELVTGSQIEKRHLNQVIRLKKNETGISTDKYEIQTPIKYKSIIVVVCLTVYRGGYK